MSGLEKRRLHRRKDGAARPSGSKFGRKTVFDEDEEKDFVKFLDEMQRLRLPRWKKVFEFDIQFLVRYYAIENPFTDDIPG